VAFSEFIDSRATSLLSVLGVTLPFKDVLHNSAALVTTTANFATVPVGEVWEVTNIASQIAASGFTSAWLRCLDGALDLIHNVSTGTDFSWQGTILLVEGEYIRMTSDKNFARADVQGVKRYSPKALENLVLIR